MTYRINGEYFIEYPEQAAAFQDDFAMREQARSRMQSLEDHPDFGRWAWWVEKYDAWQELWLLDETA